MDDQQFDSLARALAGTTRRRSLFRALAGGGIAGLFAAARRGAPEAAAHHGSLSAGDACYDSSQCIAADAPLVCADNGFDYDGPLNCCTFDGSRCFSDEGCCGQASCLDGFCSLALVVDYAGRGEPCQESWQCTTAGTYCDYVAVTNDFRCCSPERGQCVFDQDCCGSIRCIAGLCDALRPVATAGDPCDDSSQCVAADTSLSCDYVANTDDFRCCAYEGSRCGNNRSCCGSATCVDGFCATAPLYSGPGERCQNSSQCRAADTSVYCDYVANTNDYRCCAYAGGRCFANRSCCGSLTCTNGFCG